MPRYKLVPWAKKYRVGTDGSVWSKHSGEWRRLILVPGSAGYPVVSLAEKGGVRQYHVHKLVLTVFRGPCPPGMQACHFPKRDPRNNTLRNLHWNTPRANQKHRDKQGTALRGEDHGGAKLTVGDVLEIRRMCKTREKTQRQIAETFGVSRCLVQWIHSRRLWKHI